MFYFTRNLSLARAARRLREYSFIVLAVLLSAAECRAGTQNLAWEEHMTEASTAQEHKQAGQAEKLFKTALAEADSKGLRAETLRGLAKAYLSQGRLDQAAEVCKEALAIEPDDDEAVDMLIQAYDKLGKVADCASARSEQKRISAKMSRIDFGTYMTRLQDSIKKQWHPPKRGQSQRITVRFILARDGSVLATWLTKSSGDKDVDEASTSAVEQAGPFAALPAGAPENITIGFTFDYNFNKSLLDAKDKNVEHAEEQLRSAEKRIAADNPQLAWHMVETANVYRTYREYDEAVPLYNKALAIQTKSFGDNHPLVGRTTFELGKCYSMDGKFADAEPLFQKALKIGESQESSDHDSALLKDVLGNYGKLLYKMGRKEEGDKYFAQLKALVTGTER